LVAVVVSGAGVTVVLWAATQTFREVSQSEEQHWLLMEHCSPL